MSEVETGRRPDTDRALRRMGRGSLANLFGTAVSALANFGLTVVLTRGLSQSSAGTFISLTSVFLIVAIVGQLGTNVGLVYFVSRSTALGRPAETGSWMRLALTTVLGTALVVGALTVLSAHRLAAWMTTENVGRTALALIVLICFVPAAEVENLALAGIRGLGSMRANALIEFIFRPVLQVLLVLGVLVADRPGLLALAWALPYLPAAVWSWWSWRRLVRRSGGTVLADPRAVDKRAFWAFSGPRAITSVVQIVIQRLDIVLVAALAGPVPAAIYAAATRFVVVGQMGNNAISLAAQPRFAETIARQDQAGLRQIYQTSTAWLICIAWPLHLTFIVSGELLLTRVFGADYAVGATTITVLAGCMLLSTAIGMADPVLSMGGHTALPLANSIAAVLLQIGLDLWLIPEHGVIGAAIGWGAAILLRNVAALVQCGIWMRIYSLSPPVLIGMVLTGVCFAGVPILARSFAGEELTGLLTGLALAGALYLPGLWWLREELRIDALLGSRRKGDA